MTPIASHTGANEPRLREALETLLSPTSAAAATSAPAAPVPPPPEAGKIDTRGAQQSGLAALLQLMSEKQKGVDKLKAQLRAAEAELAELQKQLQSSTGTVKNSKL